MLGPEKCLDWNSLCIITKFFAVPTFLVKRMHQSFAIGTLLRKPPARTTSMDRLLISRAFLLCTHLHLVTQESQLCSCLRKCKWNANRYHNDVHCTYCKHRTKRRISGIESPLHSCWDKITVKNRRWGFLDARGGGPEPLEPPLATPLWTRIYFFFDSQIFYEVLDIFPRLSYRLTFIMLDLGMVDNVEFW